MPTIFPSTRFYRYIIAVFLSLAFPGDAISQPESIKVVLNATSEIQALPAGRLPLYVLPISGSLDQLTDQDHIITYLKALSHRGIAYSVNWRPKLSLTSIAQSLQIAQLQSGLGMQVVANASACLNYFFDGSQETGHIDAQGQTFFRPFLWPPIRLSIRFGPSCASHEGSGGEFCACLLGFPIAPGFCFCGLGNRWTD